MSDPVMPINLDIQSPAREFRLRIAAGTSPVIAVTLLDAGVAFDPTGWTGSLCHYADLDAEEYVAIAESDVDSNVMEFASDATKTNVVGTRLASVLLTKDGATIEFGRGRIEFVKCPPMSGAAELAALAAITIAPGWQLVVNESGQIDAVGA